MVDKAPNVTNSALIMNAFGYWPSFHDAEVKWIRLDRSDADTLSGPILEMLVHCFEMTKRITPDGFYELVKHHLVRFRFSEISDLKLEDFNIQDAIFGLRIEDMTEQGWEGPRLNVAVDPAFGVSTSFYCSSGEVVEVTPCSPKGDAL